VNKQNITFSKYKVKIGLIPRETLFKAQPILLKTKTNVES